MSLIFISGLARSGKNTFGDLIQQYLAEKHSITSRQFSFAEQLKSDLDPFLSKFGFNVWTEDTKEKTLIRPLCVAFGCAMRDKTGGQYWIDQLEAKLLADNSQVKLVTDLRFPNEAQWAQNLGAKIIHLRKYTPCTISGIDVFDLPPNDEEFKNDPIVSIIADYHLKWPTYGTIGNEAKQLVWNFMDNNKEIWQ